MTMRIILVLLLAAMLLQAGCDLGGTTGTPATSNMVPHATNNPYTGITNSILGIYNGLQESNPTRGMIQAAPSGDSQGETSSETVSGRESFRPLT